MTQQSSPKIEANPLTAEQVSDYLRTHPKFFQDHEPLLEHLRLPHNVGGAISLIERQVQTLRKKNKNLEIKLLALVKAAKSNEILSTRMHNLALALMNAEGLDDVLAVAQEQLIDAFKADSVIIKLVDEAGANNPNHAEDKPEATTLFSDAFESHRPICGRLTDQQTSYLFVDSAEAMNSAVFVPMSNTKPIGYLAIGSHDKTRFHPGMGTLFLDYLGELVSQAISAQMNREPS